MTTFVVFEGKYKHQQHDDPRKGQNSRGSNLDPARPLSAGQKSWVLTRGSPGVGKIGLGWANCFISVSAETPMSHPLGPLVFVNSHGQVLCLDWNSVYFSIFIYFFCGVCVCVCVCVCVGVPRHVYGSQRAVSGICLHHLEGQTRLGRLGR